MEDRSRLDDAQSQGDAHRIEILAWAASFVNGLLDKLLNDSRITEDKVTNDILAKLCAVSMSMSTQLEVGAPTLGPQSKSLIEGLVSSLGMIVTRPRSMPSKTSIQDTLASLDQVRYSQRDEAGKAEAESAVVQFFSEADTRRKEDVIKFCKLVLNQSNPDSSKEGISVDVEDIPQHTTEKMISSIWDYSECDACKDVTRGHAPRYHPTRLYLRRSPPTEDNTLFDILIHGELSGYWQEIGFCKSRKRKVKFEEESASRSQPGDLAKATKICSLLADRPFARIHLELGHRHLLEDQVAYGLEHGLEHGNSITLECVLEKYSLSVAQKIALSCAVASAFWQFYGTRMMMGMWTSRNICFMPQRNAGGEELPCKLYISFPFDRHDYDLDEFSSARLIHKFPRIFALAVLLLEIGLGKPISTSELKSTDRNFVGLMNKNCNVALMATRELKKQTWGGYKGKGDYDKVIDNCTNSTSFLPQGQASQNMTVSARQDILYRKVVVVLQNLADSFTQDNVPKIWKKRPTHQNPISSQDIGDLHPIGTSTTCTSFGYQSISLSDPRDWLQGLKKIAAHVYGIYQKRKRVSVGVIRPARVAILDSGCNFGAKYFEDDETHMRTDRIKGRKDFVNQSEDIQDQSEDIQDSDGHGTLMAKLVIETAVTAELFIAKVSTNNLEPRAKETSEAIKWAGIENNVDIISMSFNVQDDDDLIKKAIMKVRDKREDKVIFLAAAGNSGIHEVLACPARYRDVIPIRAADSIGSVAPTNPATDVEGPVPFATYGDDIPTYVHSKDDKPQICRPESSVSTAVAAGIAATMLLYSQLLLSDQEGGWKYIKNLRTKEGIEALFRKMSTYKADSRCRFIDPIYFFRKTKAQRLCSIIDSLDF